jgi:hypothetical protein
VSDGTLTPSSVCHPKKHTCIFSFLHFSFPFSILGTAAWCSGKGAASHPWMYLIHLLSLRLQAVSASHYSIPTLFNAHNKALTSVLHTAKPGTSSADNKRVPLDRGSFSELESMSRAPPRVLQPSERFCCSWGFDDQGLCCSFDLQELCCLFGYAGL